MSLDPRGGDFHSPEYVTPGPDPMRCQFSGNAGAHLVFEIVVAVVAAAVVVSQNTIDLANTNI